MIGKVEVPAESLDAFTKLKMKRAYRWIVYKFDSEKKRVVVEALGEPTSTFVEFAAKVPATEPRFLIYDMEVISSEGMKQNKLLFILYVPNSCPPSLRILYAAGKDAFGAVLGSGLLTAQVI